MIAEHGRLQIIVYINSYVRSGQRVYKNSRYFNTIHQKGIKGSKSDMAAADEFEAIEDTAVSRVGNQSLLVGNILHNF